jgi:hypothetical protein
LALHPPTVEQQVGDLVTRSQPVLLNSDGLLSNNTVRAQSTPPVETALSPAPECVRRVSFSCSAYKPRCHRQELPHAHALPRLSAALDIRTSRTSNGQHLYQWWIVPNGLPVPVTQGKSTSTAFSRRMQSNS